MADYWKSQARKYCDFCKCWISDNKPSVQFHENGKRHKAAVEEKLKEIGRKSAAEEKAKAKMDNEMKKMEEAAIKAYMKDIQQNPDMMSQNIIEKAKAQNITIPKILPEKKKTQWHEAKTNEGEVYYWHSMTGDSKWDVPTEGFISMKDQSVQKNATIKHKPPKRKDKHKDGGKHKKKFKKDFQAKKEPKEEGKCETKPEAFEPFPAPHSFGRWEKVDAKVPEQIDFQLPERICQQVKISQSVPKEPRTIEFKEKTVASVASSAGTLSNGSSSVEFKKRKINRGNARQRSDNS